MEWLQGKLEGVSYDDIVDDFLRVESAAPDLDTQSLRLIRQVGLFPLLQTTHSHLSCLVL